MIATGARPGTKKASIETEALSAFRIEPELARHTGRGQVREMAPQLRASVIADGDSEVVARRSGLNRRKLHRQMSMVTQVQELLRQIKA